MQIDIRPAAAPQLTGLVATAGIGSIALKWDDPQNVTHKGTEVWSSATSDVSTATRIGITTDFTYVVVDANPNQPMYYWVRSINVYGRADGPWSVSVTKAGNAVSGTAAKMLSMGASSQIFSVGKSGVAAPATVNLYASAQNLQGVPTWAITSGTATLNDAANANAYQRDLTYASMSTDQVTVQVTQDGMTDQITIVKVKDGVDTITGMLTNEAANVAADFSGAVSSFANSGGNFKVYQGTVDKSASAIYSVVSPVGITISINAAGAYLVSAMTADNGSATLRAVYAGVTIDKLYTITKAKSGQNGTNGTNGGNGSDGVRGTVNLQGSGYSAWSDSAANTLISSNGYGGPQRGDIVTLYDATHSFTKFYSGGVWNTMTAYINGNLLVAGTLSASQITAGTMSADRLFGGTISGTNINISNEFKVTIANGASSIFIHAPEMNRPHLINGDISQIPAATVTSYGSGTALVIEGGGGNIISMSGGGSGMVQQGSATHYLSHILANVDNACFLGDSSHRWAQLYVASGVISTSDARTKTDVKASDLGLKFINALNPVSYRQVVAQNIVDFKAPAHVEVGPPEPVVEIITPRPGMRRHYGLIAQEVREAMKDNGVSDAAFWVLGDAEDADSQQGLRYEELISPLIKAVQELSAVVRHQQEQIDELRAKASV